MTSRKLFERAARRLNLPLGRIQEPTGDGPRLASYTDRTTQIGWLMWVAGRRSKR